MQLLNITSFKQNINVLSGWVDSAQVPQVINTVTYDLYESNNPFRRKFDENDINNKTLRVAANTTTSIGAECFSMFTNPYYLTHKVTKIPTLYTNAVDAYNKMSNN